MVIAYEEETVRRYMREAVEFSQDRPVLIDRFLEDATEVDVDCLSDGEDVLIAGEGVPARVESILYEGERYAMKLLLGDGQVLRAFNRERLRVGESVRVIARAAWRL